MQSGDLVSTCYQVDFYTAATMVSQWILQRCHKVGVFFVSMKSLSMIKKSLINLWLDVVTVLPRRLSIVQFGIWF